MSKATWPLAVAGSAVLAAALALPGGAAYASAPAVNQGDTSVASDNQGVISLNIPVNICGVAVAVLGSAESGCQGGAVVGSAPAGSGATATGTTAGNTSIGSGNKVSVPVSVPVNVCGVSVAVLGAAKSGCQGGANVGGTPPPPPSGPPLPAPAPTPPPPPKHHKPPRHHKPPKHHRHHGCPEHHTTGGGSTGSASLAAAVGSLPTTGMNLAGVLAAALGLLGAGTTAVFATRRRPARTKG